MWRVATRNPWMDSLPEYAEPYWRTTISCSLSLQEQALKQTMTIPLGNRCRRQLHRKWGCIEVLTTRRVNT